MSDPFQDGGTAFPIPLDDRPGSFAAEPGMSLRDYFAAKAPAASQDWIDSQMGLDRARNPHNDSYKPRLRSEIEIRAAWAFQWADAMLKARQQ